MEVVKQFGALYNISMQHFFRVGWLEQPATRGPEYIQGVRFAPWPQKNVNHVSKLALRRGASVTLALAGDIKKN